MKFTRLHPWTSDIREASRIQDNLKHFIEVKGSKKEFQLIAGADTAYSKKDDSVFATVVVMRFPELVTVDRARAQTMASFPHQAGFAAFREGPVIIKALQRLQTTPDLIIFDANGIAHEKGIGMASHLGLMLDLATIGCAKKRLVGEFEEPEDSVNATSPLMYNREQVGTVIRTRMGVKPLFVSIGHKIDLDSAVEIIASTTRGYRLPEPMRVAHILANKMRRNYDNRLRGSGSNQMRQFG
ncbi:MAG: endonuclease V [Candidatus Zixiibacteriota bacterium]